MEVLLEPELFPSTEFLRSTADGEENVLTKDELVRHIGTTRQFNLVVRNYEHVDLVPTCRRTDEEMHFCTNFGGCGDVEAHFPNSNAQTIGGYR